MVLLKHNIKRAVPSASAAQPNGAHNEEKKKPASAPKPAN
jgi:hypothetical protein